MLPRQKFAKEHLHKPGANLCVKCVTSKGVCGEHTVCDTKLKRGWVPQMDNDPKPTSKSTIESSQAAS